MPVLSSSLQTQSLFCICSDFLHYKSEHYDSVNKINIVATRYNARNVTAKESMYTFFSSISLGITQYYTVHYL